MPRKIVWPQIHALLVPMRSAPFAEARGATPALTKVSNTCSATGSSPVSRHALHWNGNRWIPNPTVIQEQLNDELSRADLFCLQDASCGENRLGYLGRVTFEIQTVFLVVRTSIGVQVCGTDDSAYIYELTDNRWRRIWQSEQNSYTEKMYLPQRLVEVKISPADWHPGSDRTEHLIVTAGELPWCTPPFGSLVSVYYLASGKRSPPIQARSFFWTPVNRRTSMPRFTRAPIRRTFSSNSKSSPTMPCECHEFQALPR